MPQWGPIIPNSYYYEVKEAISNNNELKVKISYLTYRISSLADDGTINYKLNSVEKTGDSKNVKQIYRDNESYLPELTLIFEKENNAYIF